MHLGDDGPKRTYRNEALEYRMRSHKARRRPNPMIKIMKSCRSFTVRRKWLLSACVASVFVIATTVGNAPTGPGREETTFLKKKDPPRYAVGDTAPDCGELADDFSLADTESYGFFADVTVKNWMLLRERVGRRQNHAHPDSMGIIGDSLARLYKRIRPAVWYQNNYEPDFTCMHERRVGGMGDGPKWVCDPHRIVKKDCIVYSIGSNGDFTFELGIEETLGKGACQIHIFDPKDYSRSAPEGMHFHPWGLASESSTVEENFKTMKQIVNELGHAGKKVDIFKIDCEHCEWSTYDEWFDAGVTLTQILVEVHRAPSNAEVFFETMQEKGYVTFHKEANIMHSGGRFVEYAFLKLAPSFSDGRVCNTGNSSDIPESV